MYSLDINFLKERKPQEFSKSSTPTEATPTRTFLPLAIGGAVGLFFPLFVGGWWFGVNWQIEKLQKEIAALDQELSQLQAQKQTIQQKREQLQQAEAEAKALADIFNQIKPISAILNDISDRVPSDVQIRSIQQNEIAPSGEAEQPSQSSESEQLSPPPTAELTISGVAKTYRDANYFLLTLQRSKFLKQEAAQLQSAQTVNYPAQVDIPENQEIASIEPRKVVEYTITTQLNNRPASELLRELSRKGAMGLVTRIRTLQKKRLILEKE